MKKFLTLLFLIGNAYGANPVPELDWGIPIDITDFGVCDVTITTGDANWNDVNDSANAVVCIAAGDHTAKGTMNITDGGSADAAKTVSAVTLNDPVRVDFTAVHGWSTDDIIWCDENVGGTWQMRWRYFKVTVIDTDTVDLQGEDGSGASTQPAWDAFTSAGTCKRINFKVIRHATNLASHPYLLAGGSKAIVDEFDCDSAGSTEDDDYILLWGLSFDDHDAENNQNSISGGAGCDHFVVAYNEFDSSTAVPSNIILVSDSSDFNVIQDNTFTSNATSATNESLAIQLFEGVDGTRVVGNEVWNMTAHFVQHEVGSFEGTVIAGNYNYITTALYADCDGTPNVNGICACSESSIVFKGSITPDPGVQDKDRWIRVEANMFSGLRPTVDVNTCSGISAEAGAAISSSKAGVLKSRVLVKNNVMWDMQHGILHSGSTGNEIDNWSIVGNILKDIDNPRSATSSSWDNRAVAFQFYTGLGGAESTNNEIALNTVVNADHWFSTGTAATGDMTCNIFIDSGSRSSLRSYIVDNNYVYGDTTGETVNDTDGGITSNANMADLTIQPFIITDPTTDVTLTDVLTTTGSPHADACPNLGSAIHGIGNETVTF